MEGSEGEKKELETAVGSEVRNNLTFLTFLTFLWSCCHPQTQDGARPWSQYENDTLLGIRNRGRLTGMAGWIEAERDLLEWLARLKQRKDC